MESAQKPAAVKKRPLSGNRKAAPEPKAEKALRTLSANAQARIEKKFFELASKGNVDMLAKQIARLETALVDTKPVINARNRFKETVLIVAAEHGENEICALLLEKGAEVEAEDSGGETALMVAAMYGHKETCALLIGKGANTEATDAFGETALMYAARKRYSELCKLLVEKGADADRKNNYGKTASMVASQCGHDGTAAFLKSMEKSPEPGESV